MHGLALFELVVLVEQDILLMVGPYGDWVKYNLDEKVELVTEIDGVRDPICCHINAKGSGGAQS